MQAATATIQIGTATVEHCASKERCLAADARSEGPKAPDSDLQLKAQCSSCLAAQLTDRVARKSELKS